MSEKNPSRLAAILEDLLEEIIRWSAVASDTCHTAHHQQQSVDEKVQQIERNSLIIQDRTERDKISIEDIHEKVDALLAKGNEAKELAQTHLSEVNAILSRAQSTLTHWSNELNKALDWLARAEERVRKAQAELAAAKANLRSAESELWSAESALRSCLNYRDDKGNRRNCSGQAARVSSARTNVARAQERVHLAEIELVAALKELERAQARVACCQRAVEFAEEAVKEATEALEEATLAMTYGERSLEIANSAHEHDKIVATTFEEQEAVVDEMMVQSRQAINQSNEARHFLDLASQSEESAQRYQMMVRTEIIYRVGKLYDLNRPESFLD